MGTRLRPEHWAAVVNGILVLCPLPVFVALTFWNEAAIGPPTQPPRWSSWPGAVLAVLGAAGHVLPYALVAAWRTWAHARRWESGDRGWRGIAEAGVCGLLATLLGLVPATVRNPAQAPPYLVAYGGFGFIGGLAVGLLLFVTARLVLRLTGERPAVT